MQRTDVFSEVFSIIVGRDSALAQFVLELPNRQPSEFPRLAERDFALREQRESQFLPQLRECHLRHLRQLSGNLQYDVISRSAHNELIRAPVVESKPPEWHRCAPVATKWHGPAT